MADINFTTGIDNTEAKRALQEIADSALSVGKIFKGTFLSGIAQQALNKSLELTKDLLKDTIKAASEYDEALNSLNLALAASGTYSAQASQDFQDFAQAIQETTKFSDDAVLSAAALTAQMTSLSNDGVKQVTQAALDLSAAYRIDLDSATRLVAKATEGNVVGLNKLGFSIKAGATEAESFANVMRSLSSIQGMAANSSNTYDGALTKLGNSFSDLLKTLGQYITRSPALIATFNVISGAFTSISNAVKTALGNRDIFKSFVINMSVITQAAIQTGIDIARSFELAFMRAQQAWIAFKVLTTAGLSEAFNQQLIDINNQIQTFMTAVPPDNPAIQFFDNLILKVSETNGKLVDFNDLMAKVRQGVGEAADTVNKNVEQMSNAIKGQFAQGISKAVQATVQAIRTGGNAFKAFGGQILAMFGNIAIQTGETLILIGLGVKALRASILTLEGGQAIAAGIALVAFGALLNSLSSGSAAGGGGGGGGGSGGAASASEDEVTKLERNKPETSLVVNVQGNILDRRQTGLEIAEVIQETFGSNGLNFNT